MALKASEDYSELSDKKMGTFYVGDSIRVVDPDGGYYDGILRSIMSVQIYVEDAESERGKFFFLKGLKIKHGEENE
jgi:hypothetical protein